MLCPEVWKFRAPESNFKSVKGKVSQTICSDSINNFYYNHLISVILPDTVNLPESLTEILSEDCEFYKLSDFNIGVFVNKDFIENFIRRGNFTALSVNTRIDCDDCVSVTPNGLLVLSLTKETFQCLGLEGKVSQFSKHTKSRYIVKINLASDVLTSGKKYYERVKLCLKKLKNFDLLFSWEPPRADICPSSVAKYFHDLNCLVELGKQTFEFRTDRSVNVPIIDFENFYLDDTSDILEWLGMFSLKGDLKTESTENYVTTYKTPEPNAQLDQVTFLQWRGFFTSSKMKKFYTELRNYVKAEGKPWVSLYVQGFSDSPINWRENEQHYYTNGDNSYVILLNSSDFILSTQSCSSKYYSKK